MTRQELIDYKLARNQFIVIKTINTESILINGTLYYQDGGYDILENLYDKNLNRYSTTEVSFEIIGIYVTTIYSLRKYFVDKVIDENRKPIFYKNVELSMQEIANKFGIPVEELKIKK